MLIETHTKVFSSDSYTDYNHFKFEYEKMAEKSVIDSLGTGKMTPEKDGFVDYMDNGFICVHYFFGLDEIWIPK